MKAELEESLPQANVTLVEGGGGAFEIKTGEKQVFSKKKLGRFPKPREIVELLGGH